jgi:response regulator NasT
MKRLKILVADDEAIIRMGLRAMLTDLGHEVLLAANGRDALHLVRTARPNLALLDVQMPLTDGLEAARVIARKHPLPIIILTAYSQADLITAAAQLPIQGYLVKPVTERDLAAAIEVALARFADAQTAAQQIAELRESLETRKALDRAKGVLMQTGLSEDAAYHAIQQRARDNRITLRQAAEQILAEQARGREK